MHRNVLTLSLVLTLAGASNVFGQDDDGRQALKRSTSRATRNQSFDLRYKMQQGETISWEVEQIASTDTRIAGHEEKSSLRSRSVHSWSIDSVDSHGNITFHNQLVSATEWQKVGNQEPVSYDSSTEDEIPDIYLATSEKIGKPIATTTINPRGTIVNRVDHIKTAELGMGSAATPLPDQPVTIGDQWDTPEDIHARRKDKSIKTIKTRVRYTLRSVEDGKAAISFRREILTPVEDPWLKMQLQQKINQGTVLFDIARGRVVKRLVQWDEQVQGFEGDDSFLRYLGTYTMTIQESAPEPHQANQNPLQPLKTAPAERSSSYVKPRDGKPIIRK